MKHMLSAAHRLRKDKDFDRLFAKGRSVGSRALVIKYRRTKPEQAFRAAFVVSAKTAKSAVKRNRARRQLREILRKEMADIKPGYDAAFIVKPAFLPLSFEEKRQETLRLLKRAKLV